MIGIIFLIVLLFLFFNYAFFNCSYVYSLMYGMVHNKKMYDFAVFSLIPQNK